MKVYELSRDEIRQLLDSLGVTQQITEVWSMRVAIDGGFKVSVNQRTWSPPMGKKGA